MNHVLWQICFNICFYDLFKKNINLYVLQTQRFNYTSVPWQIELLTPTAKPKSNAHDCKNFHARFFLTACKFYAVSLVTSFVCGKLLSRFAYHWPHVLKVFPHFQPTKCVFALSGVTRLSQFIPNTRRPWLCRQQPTTIRTSTRSSRPRSVRETSLLDFAFHTPPSNSIIVFIMHL